MELPVVARVSERATTMNRDWLWYAPSQRQATVALFRSCGATYKSSLQSAASFIKVFTFE